MPLARALCISFFTFAVVALSVVPAAIPQVINDFSGIDEAMTDAVKSGEIPGVVVLVGRGDETLYFRAVGSRRIVPDTQPMTRETIFDIASLTKPFATTLAVMHLVERGDIRLDQPLGRYLKEFRRKEFAGVTIRRLLTHTAGLVAIPTSGGVNGGFPKAAAQLAKLPLDFPPGQYFQYSDTGFILLGEVVRRVSGVPLDRYVDKHVYKPLGLRDTMFNPPASLRDRIAPTEFHNGRLMIGEVHDPRSRALGGVAGHAGLFSTAADLARLCRMLLADGTLDGHRILQPTTVRLMWMRSSEGNGSRALGWDISSTFSRTASIFFPPEAVGHLGFTGTSVWLDPPSRTYLIVLTNRVHPSGGGGDKIRELRTRIAAVTAAQLFRPPLTTVAMADATATASDTEADSTPQPSCCPRTVSRVRTGLDVLAAQNFASIAGYNVGLVTNQTGVDAAGRRSIDLLAAASGVRLAAIFSPEHGLTGDANTDVPNTRDAVTGLPVWSLYGTTRRPTSAMLRGINLLVFDIQDVGVRYYTYLTTLVYVMEEAARYGIPVLVLDRPNPLTGRVVEGPLMDPDLASFTAPHPIPVRTGMTIGEFARMAAAERKIPVSLTIVAMEGWERGRWFDDTGLPWVNPSPNIRTLTQALLYSGVGLLEATNLSVGRGTEQPFEVVGAPWIEPHGLATELNALRLPGVTFEPVVFTPALGADRYPGVPCAGVRMIVTGREEIRPVTVGLALATALRARHREQFRPEAIQNLLVNRSTMWAFLRGESLDRLVAWTEMERSSFLNRRASYLIYR
ncbi:MAG TPA: exo-beta-N-acetylmuramidase NamZ domain-containing protein [Methylomirabilota bacterium]|nr:exo-beta-N-acetylmuramidase NamZ domain-containing protein [Methylomirabilota bacterium]